MKSISTIHPAITENTEDSFVKHASHTSMHKSHNVLISVILNPLHNIIAKSSERSASAIDSVPVDHTETL